MTKAKAKLFRSILDIDITVGELRFKLQDILDKSTARGIETDIEEFESQTIENTVLVMKEDG